MLEKYVKKYFQVMISSCLDLVHGLFINSLIPFTLKSLIIFYFNTIKKQFKILDGYR